MNDLKLIPIDDLVKELFDRSEIAICAYTLYEDPGDPIIYVNWNESSVLEKIGLCEHLKRKLLQSECLNPKDETNE